MASAVEQPRSERDTPWVILALVAASLLGHALTIWLMPERRPEPKTSRVELVEFKVNEPPPPPPPKVEEPPPPEPPPPPPKPKIKPPPVTVEAPPPPVEAPPPPNDTPPPPTDAPPPLIVAGISMSSTSEAGNIAVPVGNTAYGKADKAVDPSQVKAYAAPRYVPPGGADVEPQPAEAITSDYYPPEAKAAEVEGIVACRVYIEPDGTVSKVVVIKGPGYGLNEAAVDKLRRTKWKPAMKNGQPVGTDIIFNFRFELE